MVARRFGRLRAVLWLTACMAGTTMTGSAAGGEEEAAVVGGAARATTGEAAAGGAAREAGGVPVVEVRPALRFPAVMPPAEPDAERPLPPDPLSLERRAELVEQTFGGTAGETVTLTPRQAHDVSVGHLVLDRPQSFDAMHGAGFEAGQGAAAVRLLVEAGRAYLVDFSVNAWQPGSYAVDASGTQLSVADAQAGVQGHVLVGLEAVSPGWTTVRISRPGSGFWLHAVAVTPVSLPAAPAGDQSDS